ncbi:acetate/propionate family kinase [Azospirillum sp. TSO35-2]|uniref:acetate/propionate family kinase n=1 Tax=Azospirillum sp. TSO35-2 TaxID=716796 RepID=UPI000D605832|nr:acetate/propionate family kinase [Azospirillum sp. TSO35-2]PWC32662.1 acetate kinase [Azospirillum sp. TSO35-2]
MSNTTPKAILVVNAGSSSLKFSVFRDSGAGDPVVTINGQISGIGTQPVFEAKDAQRRPLEGKSWGPGEPSDRTALLGYLLDWIHERLEGATLIAAGHRVVHGGVRHAAPVLLTPALMDELDGLVPLAPLHQPHNLAAIRALAEAHPELPQVACFDTAFHRNQPWQAQTFAIPRELTDEGVRRYGFHGLSYEYIARRLPEIAPELGDSRVVVAHLGSGASMCAIHGGRSVDSTMGFTALDGLPMGTRCGAIDPGVLIYLMRKGMDASAIETLLYNKSGLLGVSGVSNDMRALLESSDPHAQEAVELFCFRIAKETGALSASMGGVDALVFTAGIGERSAPVRARVGDKLAWLGVEIDAAANEANAAKISTANSRLPVYVIPTDEERMIALHTRKALTGR